MGRSDHQPGLKPVRSFPYLKLQHWDETVGAWKEIQRKFSNQESLLAYARRHLPRDRKIRIMIVEDRKTRRVLKELNRVLKG